ncbi:MAG TPA: glycoside hydrolase family 3 N-terminal domain-containing protein [Bryobacteraceae bacterium]|nr:glycoside hydrolase family 3 N-terminal domain-containing protein [Bryobacteraceae bacterium]
MVKFRFAALLCLPALACLIATSASEPRKFSSYDPQANALIAKMTLDEKVGQMTQPDQSFLKSDDDIVKYSLGSLLSGGDSDPKEGNSLEAWTNMVDRYMKRALETRLAIPLLYGVDALHGHNNVLGAVVFPHNVGLGCTRNRALIEKIARITADEVRATGINWAFAPCVAVPRDIRWGRSYEGFAEEPELVKELGPAAVRGLQGADLADPLSVLACSKHYMGDGGTAFGSSTIGQHLLDQGDTRLDEKTLREIHLQGYITTIRAGVGTIMPSYNSWNGQKASASKRLLTEILKDELGFEGFLISDYGAIDQLSGDYKHKIAASINAGMDMVMVPEHYQEFIARLKEAAQDGTVPMARIDDAVRRILRVKFAMGLMDKNHTRLAARKLWKQFGSPEHRAVARAAVRQSLVLLKNGHSALPLAKSAKRIHVGGKNADDIGNQCGGWTITWQGNSGNVTPGGTTILAAIKKAASPATKVTFSADGKGAEGADVGVVVIGEKPYAEMNGDRRDLALPAEDVSAVENMKKAGIPVVVVLLSGRPMILSEVLDKADAVIAAWLPGTEGEGVTDVLFGAYKPTGKLSFAWPRSMAQVTMHRGDAGYDPLFAYGYGLSY